MFKYKRDAQIGLFFIFPQIFITIVFFLWPSLVALIEANFISDPFGISRHFIGLNNFKELFLQADYLSAFEVTFVMSLAITIITMILGLILALLVHKVKSGRYYYKAILLWPYAIAPAVAAILWRFLFHPSLGWLTQLLNYLGFEFNYLLYPKNALWLIIITASWQQCSYNFLFYYAALKKIPTNLIEAAILDGASALRRFWQIVLPLLSPISFFLLSMNVIFALFDTFGIIHIITHGGPGNSTTTLMYKVYKDGFINMDFGSASAQSIVLILIVIALTFLQFKFLDKKVHYQ